MQIITIKQRIAISLVLLLPLLTIAQNPQGLQTNSHNFTSTNDTILLNSYCFLQLDYSETNRDSSIYYGYKALELSKKFNQKFYVACTLSDLGFALLSNGDYSNALNALLEASKLAENKDIAKNVMPTPYISDYTKGSPETNRIVLLGYIKNTLALLYGSTRNAQRQLQELFEAKQIVENGTDDKYLLYSIVSNIANAYFKMEKLDSAMYYQRQVMEIEKKFVLNNYSGASLKTIGDIFYKKGNLDSAKKYYSEGLFLIEKKNANTNYLASTQVALADLYRKNGEIDSSLYYAKAGLKNYISLGSFIPEMVESYTNLSLSFKENKRYDSAYFYMQAAKKLSDSLNETEINNLSTFQKVGFEEQLRLKAQENERVSDNNKRKVYLLFTGLGIFSIIAYILYRNNRQKQKANKVLQQQKEEIQTTLTQLKSTQAQLIQSEKMASLGELTAGIAHEIQNPLNFVNNFSEVNKELVDELENELENNNNEKAILIAKDIKENEEKINHHGKRADSIVKGMLQHSRVSTGQQEPTNINALADEYLRLSYHGMRAKDKDFNATIKTEFDESVGKINIILQDIGRVLLNLYNNAFYATNEQKKTADAAYQPLVSVQTKKINDKIEIKVSDNGNGISQNIVDKIFQPFFTTKPTGQGTGLGLSLSYDILKAHGGEIKVETKEGEGSEFTIVLQG